MNERCMLACDRNHSAHRSASCRRLHQCIHTAPQSDTTVVEHPVCSSRGELALFYGYCIPLHRTQLRITGTRCPVRCAAYHRVVLTSFYVVYCGTVFVYSIFFCRSFVEEDGSPIVGIRHEPSNSAFFLCKKRMDYCKVCTHGTCCTQPWLLGAVAHFCTYHTCVLSIIQSASMGIQGSVARIGRLAVATMIVNAPFVRAH